MRRTRTLIITLFIQAQDSPQLRGRVRRVSDGHEATFSHLEELLGQTHLIGSGG